ncbi:unnamed protein product, partial [marine sediment metagenome]
ALLPEVSVVALACLILNKAPGKEICAGSNMADDAVRVISPAVALGVIVTSSLFFKSFLGRNGPLAKSIVDKSEWLLRLEATEKLRLMLQDESVDKTAYRESITALSAGYHIVHATYNGVGGSKAANGIKLYVDGAEVASRAINDDDYVAMENLAAKVTIGARYAAGVLSQYFKNKMDNVVIFNKELTAAEVAATYTKPDTNFTDWVVRDLSSGYPICETPSPYQEDDLFELQFRQSADVMWIVHPDYAPRKLSRTTPTSFDLSTIDFANGPF